MKAKIERWGDEFAVRLTSRDVADLGVSEGHSVEITAQPDTASARRWAGGLPVYTMAEMIAQMRRLGPGAEPPTVDWGPDRGSEIIDDAADPH